MAVCGGCGSFWPDTARFCSACGSPLAAGPSFDGRARKTVTLVFADVVGWTELGERLDPETVRQIMARYFQTLWRVLQRHGGTVEKFVGDAVMAVFGIPMVREDDALRATRAAVEMAGALRRLNDELERRWGVSVEVRIGVNTGEVVADDPSDGQVFATGDPVNVAARLQQAAQPGQVLIGESTRRLLGNRVVVAEVAPLVVKGKSSLVRAARVLSVTPQTPTLSPPAGYRFVGRERELQLLCETFERCVQGPVCRSVTILGEAGIGKSRLVREALQEIGASARIVIGRCPPYGEGITYLPLLDIVRQLAPAGQADLASLVEGEQEGDLVADRIAGAVGLSTTSAPTEETNWAVRRLFEALARRHPLVVVLDDVHWAEPTFLDLVEHIVASARAVPLLVLCLTRPELLDARPTWQASSDNATVVRLGRLADHEARALLTGVLGGAVVAEATGSRVLEAAEGNPLFLEQLLAMHAEHGEDFGVPPTVQAVLAARIDRLPPVERTVLQRAAVQGRVFSRQALAELVGEEDLARLEEALVALERRDLIRPDPHALGAIDGVRFAHGLVRDAAYQFLPKATRSQLHERLAGWLDQTVEQRPVELEEVVGYHLEQAYRYRTELGPVGARERALGAQAARRLDSSGRRALGRSDLPAAIKLLERAAALLSQDDRGRVEVLACLGAALTEAGKLSEADRVLQEAVDCARLHGEDRLEGHAVVEQLFLRIQVDTEKAIAQAREVGERVRGVFEEHEDHHGLSKLWRLRALVHWLEGRCRAADDAWGQAAEHARKAGDDRERAEILSWVASSAFIGPTPVWEAIRRCEAIRDQVEDHRRAAAATLYPLAGLYAMIGRFDAARELLDFACQVLEDLGFVTLSSSFTQYEGFVESLAGDLARAEQRLALGLGRLEEMGEKAFVSSSAALLAEVLHQQGRQEDAARFVDRSVETAAPDDLAAQISWRTVRAKILAAAGRLEDAEAHARRAVSLAAETDRSNDHAAACVALGGVLRDRGRPQEAETAIREALALYQEKENIVAAEGIHALLGKLLPHEPLFLSGGAHEPQLQ
jgi:class 3 adenylate cyclase/tetratricopeptide (TPR) repeat protein